MPFTVAHVMAVLPGVHWHARLRLDPTCLVIGSMAPDFEYFARGELVSRFSHTLAGLVTWNLPATLVLAVLWHAVVKQPVLAALPVAMTRRLAPVVDVPWRARWDGVAVASLVVSAVLGAATHLAWDALTHANGLARHLPALRVAYDVPGAGTMVLHRILQHASTLVGLAALGAYVAFALRRHPPAAALPARPRAHVRAVFAACIALALALIAYRMHLKSLRDPGSLIAGTISGLLAGTLVASALLRRRVR